MSFNGTGTFVRLYNWVNNKNASINITASRMDGEMDGMATGLSNCVTRDGQSPASANLPMGGFAHTNVGTGSARNQYATIAQVEDSTLNWAVAGGTVDALTATYSPAVTALIDGQLCYVRAAGTNLTTSPSFSPNGLTARTITKQGGSALSGSDWTINTELVLRYNLANTRWEWINAFASQSSTFSDSAFRIQDNGDATKQVAFEVSGITTGTVRTITVPDANITLVGTTAVQTLTNKTLTAPTIGAGTVPFAIYDQGTFVPTIAFGGASVGVTYGAVAGSYTRIGNKFIYNGSIVLTSKGSSTGVVTITGFPFPSTIDATANSIFAAAFTGLTGALHGIIAGTTSVLQIYQTSAAGSVQVSNTAVTNTSTIFFGGHFNV